MPYEYLDDLAIADIAFRAWGRTLDEVFRSAADATLNVMIEDLESVRPRVHKPLHLESHDLEMLLFDFLQELIYYKDAERLLLRVPEPHVVQEDDVHRLDAVATGEPLDVERHPQRVDVKAVTLHRFELRPTAGGWQAVVILDV